MNEFDLIHEYFTWPIKDPSVILGVGDDAALLNLEQGYQVVTTIDTLVEGVHFSAGTPAKDIAHKSLAVNLSDIASMGAKAKYFTLAITLPKTDKSWLQEFSDSLRQLSGQYEVSLVIFSGIFGFGGAFISLAISKWMAKRMTGAKVIEQPANSVESWLLETVEKQSGIVGIKMPEVAIFPSGQMNAFATGASKNNALVAVSQGLLDNMSQGEIEAVVGHEMSHVANGDMVTLTLIQGVVNTFVIFFSRVIGHVVDRVILKNRSGHGIGYFVTVIFAQVVLSILASIVVMYFSRKREFIADTGGADLAGHQNMINALKRLAQKEPEPLPEQLAAFGIGEKPKTGWSQLWASHPPLENRIKVLEARSIQSN